MKLLIINVVCGTGSTGRICSQIAKEYKEKGWDVKIAFGREELVPEEYRKDAVLIGNKTDVRAHAIYTRLTDRHGFGSKGVTKKFLQWADGYDPDIVWLHNVHGYYINIELLFDWLKKRNTEKPEMQIKWTLHDCWTMTGHCAYFTAAKCDRWKEPEGCHDCPQKKDYPASYKDASRKNFADKKRLFTGLKNLTLITPSKWLADITRESFLKEYPVEVRYNDIDRSAFRKMEEGSEIIEKVKAKYGIGDKPFLLGISNVWDRRKGLEDLLKLAYLAGDRYDTVIIGLREKQIEGLNESLEKAIADLKESGEIEATKGVAENSELVNVSPEAGSDKGFVETKYGIATPEGIGYLFAGLKKITQKGFTNPAKPHIIAIPHTADKEELAAFYNMAAVLVNPTHEDNYPTVNLEAIACGTKVLTYDVGGSAETLAENHDTKESGL